MPQKPSDLNPKSSKGVFARAAVLLLMASAILLLIGAPESYSLAQSSIPQLAAPRQAKQTDEEIRTQMLIISRQLGVSCLTCHETDNFGSDKKAAFKVAKEHMRLVQVLIDNGMNGQGGKQKADCYLCHRGQAVPASREPVDPLTKMKMQR